MGVNVFGTLIGLVGFVKTREHGTEKIDTVTFRLHYGFTTALLFIATALLSMNDMFGKDIRCIDSSQSGASKAVEQYCWVKGTYTVPGKEEFIKGIAQEDEECKLPGGKIFKPTDVGAMKKTDNSKPKCRVSHSYYQWVPFVLLFQGLLFLTPWKVWQYLEEGRIQCISKGIRIGEAWWTKKDEKNKVVSKVVKFIKMEEAGHQKYALSFVFCLLLNLINVVFCFNLLNLFINKKFMNLGWKWIEASMDPGDTILNDIFPRMTACVFKTYGTGGYHQVQNYLCILASNIVTEKVFVFLWFWYTLLITLSSASLIYHVLLLLSNGVQTRLLFLELAVSSTKINDKKDKERQQRIKNFLNSVDRYRFFLVYFLARNVEHPIMMEILDGLATTNTGEGDKLSEKHLEKRFATLEQQTPTPSAPPSAMPQDVPQSFSFQTFTPENLALQKMADIESKTPVPIVPQPGGNRGTVSTRDTGNTLSSHNMGERGSAIEKISPQPSPRRSFSNLSSSGKK